MKFGTYLKEEKDTKPKSVTDVIAMLKKNPKASDWAVKGAKGDEVQFEIPEDELKKTIGLTYEDLQKLEKEKDHKKGGVNLDDGVVSLYGEEV